ncbi:MAG: deoxyribodipyrimidine photo-lyase, partial [Pseudomonadota bacterium]|nr:deoxyribodipyrimidine photo-lyase [Pseudomonadota bacterium]
MPVPQPVIVWFRQDLRLSDNPAFAAAIRSNAPVIPVFIHDTAYGRPAGHTSLWWRNKSLAALADVEARPAVERDLPGR